MATLAGYYYMAQTMTECGYKDRLLSYYLLRDSNEKALPHYVETGVSWRVPIPRKKSWSKNRISYVRRRRVALAQRLKAYEEEGTTEAPETS